MTAAANLPEAATIAAENLFTLFAQGSLKTKLTAFWTNLQATFVESQPNDHPVANWLTLISILADQIESDGTYSQLDTAVDYVYRICFLTYQLQLDGLLTSAQAVALLAEYNAEFS